MKKLSQLSPALGALVCLTMVGNIAYANYLGTLNTIAGTNKISHWGLEETSGLVALDSWTGLDGANHGHYSGVTEGGVILDVAGPRASDGFHGFGESNNAVQFTGAEVDNVVVQRLVMGSLAQPNLGSTAFHGVGELTMTMWFKFALNQTGQRYLGGIGDTSSGVTGRYAFAVNSNANLRAFTRIQDSPEINEDSGTSGIQQTPVGAGRDDFRDDNWHFLVMTMGDNTTVGEKQYSVYVDNVHRITESIDIVGTPGAGLGKGLSARQTNAATGSLSFGYDLGAEVTPTDEKGRAMIGLLDEIAFINRALSVEDIGQLWSAATTLPAADGDFNDDGFVDAADYVVWRKTMGDPERYDLWRTTFGSPSGAGTALAGQPATVPEPAAMAMLSSLVFFGALGGRPRRSRRFA